MARWVKEIKFPCERLAVPNAPWVVGEVGVLFVAKATYTAIAKTYGFLTPDLWKETVFTKSPYQEFTDHLAKSGRQSALVAAAAAVPAGGAP